jgi:hypothetical protein
MCCVVTDGGGALVLTSAERANDLAGGRHAVYLLGQVNASEAPMMSQMQDVSSFGAFRRSSAEVFATASVTHADIDHLKGYDAFAHLPLYILEDLGFGGGESGRFIAEGHTRQGGKLPMNTNGGALTYTHTGMYGMFAIQEAVSQLRGEAAVQVPGVTISFVPASDLRLLLIIDQFEQLFTKCHDERQRQALITALHAAATCGPSQQPAAMALLAVRSDFEARCADYPELSDAVQRRYLVTPMSERQLRLAIIEPAKKAGSAVEDALVGELVEKVIRGQAPVPASRAKPLSVRPS